MKVTSDFECGNGKNIAEVAPGHWRLDEVGEKAPYCKYFCVRIEGGEHGGACRLDVYPDPLLGEEGRAGMLGHYPSPLWFSENEMEHWLHVTGRWPGADAFADDHISTQVAVPPGGVLYVASNVVFPWSRLVDWAARLGGRGAFVDSLGSSFEGREIPRVHLPPLPSREREGVRVGAVGPRPSPTPSLEGRGGVGQPLVVFVFSGQHPSEQCGPLAACGIAEFLTSAHPEALALRERCDVWIVPNINVDGNVRGRNGWTADDVNPCSDFGGACEGVRPKAVEDRLLWDWLANDLRPDVCFNFHGYLGTHSFAERPGDGCYVLPHPEEVYASSDRRRAYEAVRDALFWDTPGLTARATPGQLTPNMLSWNLARAFGTLVPFYEINHSFHSIQGAKRKGVDVFRAVMKAVLATLVFTGGTGLWPVFSHSQAGRLCHQDVSAGEVVATGQASPSLKPFDDLMASFMADHKVPGGALAVTKDGRLVYARGFGYADVERKEPVQPTSLFRIASLSKPLTGVAVLQLVERGKLKLDDRVFDLLKLEPHLEPGASPDPRLKQITIGQLLYHTGGWDREKSFDPMFRSVDIAKALGVPSPAKQQDIIRYMMGQPLQFDPGQSYAYSNFGYCLLGRVIEAVTGQSYEAYVQANVLAPLGITGMRIGRTLESDRFPGEVKYYTPDARRGPAVVGERAPRAGERSGELVPWPYGAWYLEGFDSHGGWIASAVDMVRFAAEFDDPSRCRLLKPESIAMMFARPADAAGCNPDGSPKAVYYGCGWSVRPVGDRSPSPSQGEGRGEGRGREDPTLPHPLPGRAGGNHWHMGMINGTATLLVRRCDGLCWAVMFNTHAGPDGKFLGAEIDSLVHRAADAVKSWPAKEEK